MYKSAYCRFSDTSEQNKNSVTIPKVNNHKIGCPILIGKKEK